MGDDGGDEDSGVMLIMIMMVGAMITVMEMINVMTVSWLPVLSVPLIIHPSHCYTRFSCAGSQEGWSVSQHALGE